MEITRPVMKTKQIALFAALAAAYCSFFSCAVNAIDEIHEPNLSKARSFNINFTTYNTDTRTAFGAQDESTMNYPVFWTGNDKVISMSMNLATPVSATVDKDDEISNKADFTATFNEDSSPYVFYAFSPQSAVRTISPSRENWTVTIPTEQTPTADGLSCDENAMLLFSKSEEMNKIPAEPIELHFSHVTTYCRLILKNLASAFEAKYVSGVTVKSVDVTFSIPVAGTWYANATDGTLSKKDASYTITLYPDITDLSQPTDIWMALAPCTLTGQTVKVSVNTDKGSLSRVFSYGTRTYTAGSVNKLSLDMTKGSSFTSYDDDPILEKEEYGAYITVDGTYLEIVHTPDEGSQLSREFGLTTTFAILYPDAVSGMTVLECSNLPSGAAKGDIFTLTLNMLGTTASAEIGTYRVTVVKEDGAKLWLSDHNGNGFIVKR